MNADDIFASAKAERIIGQVSPVPDTLTETGAAERFARRHGTDVRFDHRRGRWLLWREHRWAPDTDGAITRLAILFARTWQREALDLYGEARDATLKQALRLERRDAIRNMLALAADLAPIAHTGDRWDANPWLLGVPNGVVDLQTGAIGAGQRDDQITMQTAVPYDPAARCPRWDAFLQEIVGGDAEMAAFLERAVGYSLTGITSEQCLIMLYGTGANGKGTFTNTLKRVLGDYAWNMPFATIELRDRAAIPNDLAALVNRRFVTAAETNDGTRLNEGRVKTLTGCDPVTARFLHGEFFTFEPVAKYWLSVNHKPVVRDTSYGFWRRLRLVPFTQTFAVNPDLADQLSAEGPGILGWAVRAGLAWQRDGLNPPATVLTATTEYAEDSDPLTAFILEACDLDPDSQVRACDLFEHYTRWATQQGFTEKERLTMTMFGRRASDRFRAEKTRAGKVYFGVARRTL